MVAKVRRLSDIGAQAVGWSLFSNAPLEIPLPGIHGPASAFIGLGELSVHGFTRNAAAVTEVTTIMAIIAGHVVHFRNLATGEGITTAAFTSGLPQQWLHEVLLSRRALVVLGTTPLRREASGALRLDLGMAKECWSAIVPVRVER